MGIDKPINYLDLKPGDKIDVSSWQGPDKRKRPENELHPEKYLSNLQNSLTRQAREVNESLPDFLDDNGKIKMIMGEDLEMHKNNVADKKKEFSNLAGKTIEEWERTIRRSASNLTEMALTVLLYKILKKNFIVARSSEFDDYHNGVDQVLVYKPTGEVICGIDEVIINPSDVSGTAKKDSKLEKKMARGGANIQYGVKLEGGALVRSAISRVPAFYMSLRRQELIELLESLKNNPDTITPIEEKIFKQLLTSLHEQVAGKQLNPELEAKTKSALAKLGAEYTPIEKLVA